VKEHSAGLVETVYPAPLTLAAVTRLLRTLIEEGVPLGHPVPILQSIGQAVQVTLEHERLVDLVRADLGEMIVGRICPPHERLPVLTLDARLEGAIVQGLQDPTTGQPVVEPDLARTIGERIAALIAERGPSACPPALIVQPRARRPLAALLRLRAPQCLVLSIAELPPTQPIEVLAVIGEDPSAHPAASSIPALPQPGSAFTEELAA
jgi:flagellar biosynthesis protein FlhA